MSFLSQANDMQLYVDKVDSMDLRSLMMTVIIVSMIILFIKVGPTNEKSSACLQS